MTYYCNKCNILSTPPAASLKSKYVRVTASYVGRSGDFRYKGSASARQDGRMEGRTAGWMQEGHARPAGERRKDTVSHDAGSAASWRDPKATQPKRHHRASSTTAGRPATCLHSNVKHHTSRYRSILHVQYSRTI